MERCSTEASPGRHASFAYLRDIRDGELGECRIARFLELTAQAIEGPELYDADVLCGLPYLASHFFVTEPRYKAEYKNLAKMLGKPEKTLANCRNVEFEIDQAFGGV